MTNKAKKKRVTVNLYGHVSNVDVEYDGRLLGFVNREQFAAIIKDKKLRNKIFTIEAVSVDDVASHYDSLEGKRIVIAVRDIDGKTVPKTLFISEELTDLSYFYSEVGEIALTTTDGNMILIAVNDQQKEEDVN